MRGAIVAMAAAAMLLGIGSTADAQGRPAIRMVFYTPPLGDIPNLDLGPTTFQARFVNTGSATVELTVQLCTLGGVCVATSPCINLPIARGEGCATFDRIDTEPLYAKFVLRKTGSGRVDGLGSLRIFDTDRTSTAAVQTIRNGLLEQLLTEQ